MIFILRRYHDKQTTPIKYTKSIRYMRYLKKADIYTYSASPIQNVFTKSFTEPRSYLTKISSWSFCSHENKVAPEI